MCNKDMRFIVYSLVEKALLPLDTEGVNAETNFNC